MKFVTAVPLVASLGSSSDRDDEISNKMFLFYINKCKKTKFELVNKYDPKYS